MARQLSASEDTGEMTGRGEEDKLNGHKLGVMVTAPNDM